MRTIDQTRRRWRSLATASALTLATITPAIGLVGLGAAPAQALEPNCVDRGLATTCTFNYTGGSQEWQVPPGVNSVTFEVVGAAGGRGATQFWIGWRYEQYGRAGLGGRGGGVKATEYDYLQPGDMVDIEVGGKGSNEWGAGGYYGGGDAGTAYLGGGGGGASSVMYDGAMIVGGGGGGGGMRVPDAASASIPGTGGNGGGAAPGGGAGAGGRGMNSENDPIAGGGYGGSASPGAGGEASGGYSLGSPTPGSAAVLPTIGIGMGGAGGHIVRPDGTTDILQGGLGGGGGGGYRGGGGGGAGVQAGAGGGGGSGYGPAGSTNFLGAPSAHGVVKVTYPNPNMSQFVDMGGTTLSGDPTISRRFGSENVFDVFYVDTAGYARQRTYTDYVPAAGDSQIGNQKFALASSLAAVSWGPNRIDLFGRSSDGYLLSAAWENGNWSAWHTHTWVGKISGNPTVASWSPGRLDVFAPSVNGTLLHEAWNPGWAWEFLPGPLLTSPAAVSRGPNQIDVFYGKYQAGSGTTLRQKRWDGSNGGWQPETTVSPDAMKSAPSVSSPAAGVLNVFYQGTANQLVRERYNTDGWVRTGWTGTPFTEATVPASVSLGPLNYNIVLVRSPATNTVWGRVL